MSVKRAPTLPVRNEREASPTSGVGSIRGSGRPAGGAERQSWVVEVELDRYRGGGKAAGGGEMRPRCDLSDNGVTGGTGADLLRCEPSGSDRDLIRASGT